MTCSNIVELHATVNVVGMYTDPDVVLFAKDPSVVDDQQILDMTIR